MGRSSWTVSALALVLACHPAPRDSPATSAPPDAAGPPPIDPGAEAPVAHPNRGRLALGLDFSCALDPRGAVWCWGGNDHGQLGDGSEVPSPRPLRIAGLPRVQAIAAGDQHACALAEDGGVWCWGHNHDSQLGDGTDLDRRTPVKVQGIAPATLLVASAGYACARTADEFLCWGAAPALGRSWWGRHWKFTPQPPAPVARIGAPDLACASDAQTCVLLGDHLSCWGLDPHDSFQPDRFAGFGGAVALACGFERVCGLWRDGTSACVGDLRDFRERPKPLAPSATPTWRVWPVPRRVRDPEPIAELPKARDLVDHGWQAAAIDPAGAPWSPDLYSRVATRAPERLGTGAVALALGPRHQCLLDGTGAVLCRGYDDTGQLGSGASPLALVPERIDAAQGLTGLSSGPGYVCGVRDGEVWCWGDLKLRDTDKPAPSLTSQGPGVAVYVGREGLCILAATGAVTCRYHTLAPAKPLRHVDPESGCGLRVDGVLECEEQRLDARSFDRGEAAAVPPIATDILETTSTRWADIHCGRRRSGRISCVKAEPMVVRSGDVVIDRRGRDVPLHDAVQLIRNGAIVPPDSPLFASGPDQDIACAVRRTGEVACWTLDGEFELRARPIAGLRDVVAVSDGGKHACARLRDGTVRCWGENSCGQLGDGTVVARPLPGVVVPVRDVEELSAGRCHTCARTRAGEVWCWGRHEARTAPPRWREEFTPVVGLPAP
ncbi:RCC1 domain-containing protein [Nannocystis punicea]|uniref:Alpha-tubulin suppressor n=1 Tax=Nannocystis punicea TaxID=2995304 RepID=A0ABY7HDF4_9BACT|nr:hypothetical protein [Nannocystis poenicansa]WAS97127.1 hypothetical protein O0S08_13345 [Nannocystis poenicansa]